MVAATLTSDLLRQELFWIGLALHFAGPFVPKIVSIGTLEFGTSIGTVISAIGNLLITYLIVASIIVILWSSYEGWRYGYVEGQIDRS